MSFLKAPRHSSSSKGMCTHHTLSHQIAFVSSGTYIFNMLMLAVLNWPTHKVVGNAALLSTSWGLHRNMLCFCVWMRCPISVCGNQFAGSLRTSLKDGFIHKVRTRVVLTEGQGLLFKGRVSKFSFCYIEQKVFRFAPNNCSIRSFVKLHSIQFLWEEMSLLYNIAY